MSVAFFLAVAFLVAVLVIAEFVWLREEAEEKARTLSNDDIESRPAPRADSAAFKTSMGLGHLGDRIKEVGLRVVAVPPGGVLGSPERGPPSETK